MTQPPPLPLESQPILAYAGREDTGLAAVYRLVGWFCLVMALVTVIGTGANFLAMITMGTRTWASFGQYLFPALPRVLSIVGAVGMIQTRGWGAIAVAITYAAGLLLSAAVQFGLAPSSMPFPVLIASTVNSMLNNATFALLPLGVWRICRNRQVLG